MFLRRTQTRWPRTSLDAVRQWRYEPLLLNGTPTPFLLTVTVSFSLAD